MILITGGTGLIGTALREREYFRDAIFIGSKDCDLTDYTATYTLMQQVRPTVVIHLAAAVGGLFANMSNGIRMFEHNLAINSNVVRAAHENGVQTLIGCLSTCIFPDETTYPINERMVHNGPPHNSNYGYAYAKRMLDIHCRLYREEHGRNYFCIIPTNVYGVGDNFNLRSGHVIPGLIHKCYLAKQRSVDFVVSGTGKPLRQFINSHDVAHVIELLLRQDVRDNVIVSVDPKDEITINMIARIIAKCFDYEHKIVHDHTLPDGQYRKTVDNSRLRALLESDHDSFEFGDIISGIQETVGWFTKNYDLCRK